MSERTPTHGPSALRRRPRRRWFGRAPATAPTPSVGSAISTRSASTPLVGMVDPQRFETALSNELRSKRSGGDPRCVGSLCIPEVPQLCRRYGPLEVFDLTTELVRIVHAHHGVGDTFQVDEDGHVLVLARHSSVVELRGRLASVRDEIEATPWRNRTRLTATIGVVDITRDDATVRATDIIRRAIDERVRGSVVHSASAGSLWAEPSARVSEARPPRRPSEAGELEPRRVRGVVAEGQAPPASALTHWKARRDDIFSLREYRPPPESSRLSGAMVLPPQGSAMGVPLLAHQRSSDRVRSSIAQASAAVDRPDVDDDTPTHTRNMLDAIQASLSAHATAALDAIEASLGTSLDDGGPIGGDADSYDESFDLPRRAGTILDRTDDASAPVTELPTRSPEVERAER